MKKLWGLIGHISYFVAWPALHFYLKNSQRTRIVVQSEGKMLFVKDWLGNGKWKLPGGGLRKNEQPIESAYRELYEETGLQLRPAELTLVTSLNLTGHGTLVKLHIFTVVLVAVTSLKKQKLEILDIGWHDPKKLFDAKQLSKNTKVVLAKLGYFELKP